MDLAEAAGSPEGDTCGGAVCHFQGTAILSAGGVRGPEGVLDGATQIQFTTALSHHLLPLILKQPFLDLDQSLSFL